MLINFKKRVASSKGFSLIELLVVVLIIGILAAIMIPRFLGQRDNASNAQAQVAVKNAVAAADAFYQSNNESYGTASVIATGLRDAIIASEPGLLPTPIAIATAGAFDNATLQLPQSSGGTGVNGIYISNVSATGKAGTVTICAASKGNKSYCMTTKGTAATTSGSSTAGNLTASTLTAGW